MSEEAKKPRAVYRDMTPEEEARAVGLKGCRLPPASFAKRFAGDLHRQATTSRKITEKQAGQLAIQAYRFRRQMPAGTVPEVPPPGYSTPKQRAAEERLAAHRRELEARTAPAETETTFPSAITPDPSAPCERAGHRVPAGADGDLFTNTTTNPNAP